MSNRKNDPNTVYLEMGEEEVTISVAATQQEVEELLEKIEKNPSCIGVKLNPAWKKLSSIYSVLEKAVLTKDWFAINEATC